MRWMIGLGAATALLVGGAWLQGCGNDSCVDTATCEPSSGGNAGAPATGGGGAGGTATGGVVAKDNGESCAGPAECASDQCVDGVCCAVACDGVCEACDVAGSEGACTAIARGDDPAAECAPTSSCNGERQCGGQHIWSLSFGSAANDTVVGVAVDSQGDIVIAGNFNGTINFGGSDLSGDAMYVAKFSADGTHLWSKHFVDARVNGMSVDADDNVLLVGDPDNATVNFGGAPLVNQDMFVVKLLATGDHAWSNGYAGDILTPQAVGSDAAGTAYVCGFYRNAANLGGTDLPPFGTFDQPVFMARYTAAGVHIWSNAYGATGSGVSSCRLAVNNSGDHAVAVDFYGTLSLGGQAYTQGAIYARYDVDGNHTWSYKPGPSIGAVTFDETGQLHIAGAHDGELSFGGGNTIPHVGADDIFVVKLDATNAHSWSAGYGSADDDLGHDVAVDGDGNVIVTGAFSGMVDFGGGAIVSAGGRDAVVVALTPGAAHLWSAGFGDGGTQEGHRLAVGSDRLIVAGVFTSGIDLGGGALSAGNGGEDLFIAAMAR